MSTLVLTPTKHAQLQSNLPNLNQSGDSLDVLAIRNQATVILRHVLTFSLASLPVGATVTSAKLYLYYFDLIGGGGLAFRVHKITQAWIESQVTWNSYSDNNRWVIPGGDFNPNYTQADAPDLFTSGLANTLDVLALFNWTEDVIADFIFKFVAETEISPGNSEYQWDTRLFFKNSPPKLYLIYEGPAPRSLDPGTKPAPTRTLTAERSLAIV